MFTIDILYNIYVHVNESNKLLSKQNCSKISKKIYDLHINGREFEKMFNCFISNYYSNFENEVCSQFNSILIKHDFGLV